MVRWSTSQYTWRAANLASLAASTALSAIVYNLHPLCGVWHILLGLVGLLPHALHDISFVFNAQALATDLQWCCAYSYKLFRGILTQG